YMRKFVSDTKAKGATPIVLSPVPRNIWIDGKVERMAGTYGGWAASIAKAQNAFFIDLNEIVAARYEAIGQATVGKDYFKGDHTHTSPIGARLNAESVVAGMKTLKTLPLNNYLRAVPNTTTTTEVTKPAPTAEVPAADAIKLWPNGAPGAL